MQFKLSSHLPALNRSTFRLSNICRLFFALTLISIPFQLNSFVYGIEWGRGFLNPYTSVFFSVTELLLLATGLLFFIDRKIKKNKIQFGQPVYFFLLLLSLVLAGLSTQPDFFLLTKLFTLLLFYILIVNKILSTQEILRIFIYTLSFEAVLGFFQVLFQTDFGFSILGEPVISALNPHLARFQIFSESIVRAYGTFPHPNILGGFLAISILSTFLIKKPKPYLFIIQLLGLFACFSRSAILGLSIALVFMGFWYLKKLKEKKNKKMIIVLSTLFLLEFLSLFFVRGFHFLNDANFLERIEGYKLAWEIFLQNPWGIGFSHFTLFMDTFAPQSLMPWEYQPVHNVFLLALVEIGIPGFLFVLLLFIFCVYSLYRKKRTFMSPKKQLRRQIFFVILLTFTVLACFDHYLISLEQGRYLVLLFFSLNSLFSSEALPIYTIRKEGSLSKTPVAQ